LPLAGGWKRSDEGTLIVNLVDTEGRNWSDAIATVVTKATLERFSNKLLDHIKKLFSAYPPKKK
jgi:hypothetical protein